MTRRRSNQTRAARPYNPTRNQWVGGALVAGTVAAVAYAVFKTREANALHPGYPLPEPLPIPEPGGGPQGAGGSCDLGPSYPGFAWDGVECSPSVSTPGGIYIVDECGDFIFVTGDDGPQPSDLGARIVAATHESMQPGGETADPTEVVAAFLDTFWPQCNWPPAPDAAERIVQLFMALSVMTGRMILNDGGSVLGTSDPSSVDELVGQRFEELGLPMFRPHIVPEIELPELEISDDDFVGPPEPPPQPPDGDGPGVQEPDPVGPGLIDDDGPWTPPSLDDDEEPAQPACEIVAVIKSRQFALPGAEFTQTRDKRFKVWAPTSSECKKYRVAVGVCVRPTTSGFGLLDTYMGPNPPADLGELQFQIRRADNDGIDWDQFKLPIVYKVQLRVDVHVVGNNVIIDAPGPVTVDLADMDACPQRPAKYPASGGYKVMGTDGEWKTWGAVPQISLITEDGDLKLRVRYSGLPQFVRASGEVSPDVPLGDYPKAVARLNRETAFLLEAKVWSAGT